MKTLTLPVKKKWFDQIKSGDKSEEYRLDNSYWQKRLLGKEFDKVIITWGYPRKSDTKRRIVFPWNGYVMKNIESEEWDYVSVRVFAIKLKE